MRLKLLAFTLAAVLGLSSVGGSVLAANPHCNGNSDNVHLPNQHTEQNFPGCG